MKFNIKIPKIIHQIHLGDKPLSDQELKWQKTWRDYNPDWEFIFWNDERLKDIDIINKNALKYCKSIASKVDIIRCEIIYKLGGLYVDTDFECLKSINPFLHNKDFQLALNNS